MKNIAQVLPQNLMCFSHLRWDFVFQRPQHLLTRMANFCNVYFMEEPIHDSNNEAYLAFSKRLDNLWLCVPHLPAKISKQQTNALLTQLLDKYFQNKDLEDFAFWYYTPMALEFSAKYSPKLTIYDCMDELSAFKFAPKEIKDLEKKLMQNADIVFTGGNSLYEAKKNQHSNIYPFPSSIDKNHFEKARKTRIEPEDQITITGPKIGFYGVIDERFDIELIRSIAKAKPEWQLILIGPVVKIDPAILPKQSNIHYLDQKSYQELTGYLSGWDVALIPFLLNDSTRYISPTKTPEYLAAGIPVVSSPIRDVVNPYGKNKLVSIASSVEEFVEAIENELQSKRKTEWLKRVDAFLAQNSWDITCKAMQKLMLDTMQNKDKISIAS
ncbi:glycosyl transferase family 1 [Arcticibacter tournemirensis]|uniref:Glycosyltransferase family 1 protein n=2 Tax=Arcticibacter tournemirensis TaxID=699437 RepID=A0A5M9H941_9SPHI|nr:glycosyltransferase family 1 protein [Arcticibacter tournemirensis]TQM48883.1 glycosyl transferase family 1 [Arcticibacter tournemirensis]